MEDINAFPALMDLMVQWRKRHEAGNCNSGGKSHRKGKIRGCRSTEELYIPALELERASWRK